ncbi:N-acetylmuramoyl-L-alanine amidase [Dyella choica]|uniref:N-acetylmuramoyl-L-alanine amidase n=1 Tax=Dyella choica TaxID=1927959 RepID=A0A3S0PIT1_9GAMM|nr:N-acetylmuramoyl-L-alanine amidase [Dyella choica]RUL76021.1 N-acetylmuramoyl-L-alanine amidase [Dyella choica]
MPGPSDADAFKLLVRAFQMHFRSSDYSGSMDLEAVAILYALNDRYHRTPRT